MVKISACFKIVRDNVNRCHIISGKVVGRNISASRNQIFVSEK